MYSFNSLKFVEVCFMAHGIVYFGICSEGTWKEWLFCCWVECPINIDSILLVNGVVDSFYILADFLSSCSNDCWESSVEVSNYNCRFVHISFLFNSFILIYFVSCRSFGWNPLLLYWSPVGVVLTYGKREAFHNIIIKSQAFSELWLWHVFLSFPTSASPSRLRWDIKTIKAGILWWAPD